MSLLVFHNPNGFNYFGKKYSKTPKNVILIVLELKTL